MSHRLVVIHGAVCRLDERVRCRVGVHLRRQLAHLV